MGKPGVWEVGEGNSSAGREGCRWEQVMWDLEGPLCLPFLSWTGEPERALAAPGKPAQCW